MVAVRDQLRLSSDKLQKEGSKNRNGCITTLVQFFAVKVGSHPGIGLCASFDDGRRQVCFSYHCLSACYVE